MLGVSAPSNVPKEQPKIAQRFNAASAEPTGLAHVCWDTGLLPSRKVRTVNGIDPNANVTERVKNIRNFGDKTNKFESHYVARQATDSRLSILL
jgi:hypothetical protein